MLGHAGDLDALMIGTRCNIHTPMAVKAASTGLPLYLEKPVAISQEQIAALRDAYRGREKSVVVSFPMRVTPLFQAVMEVVESGRLGVVNQVQAVNYVPYGGVYYARETYRDFDVTGGMWLQKATHDFDYLNALLGVPTAVSAVMTRKAYGGGMPHDLRCSACDRAGT
jgi:predicted dehydrogenase